MMSKGRREEKWGLKNFPLCIFSTDDESENSLCVYLRAIKSTKIEILLATKKERREKI